jgi:hypothetical protein
VNQLAPALLLVAVLVLVGRRALRLDLNPVKLLVIAVLVVAVGSAVLGRGGGPAPAASVNVTALAGVPEGSVTPASWAQALLASLGDQATAENIRAVTAWERAEGGHWSNTAAHNPLNTTQPEPGSWPVNGVGVQAYPSWNEGLGATVATLQNGRYGAVLSALRAGDCASCVAGAVGASPWGTGTFPT